MPDNWLQIFSIAIQGGLLITVARLANKVGHAENKIETMWQWWMRRVEQEYSYRREDDRRRAPRNN